MSKFYFYKACAFLFILLGWSINMQAQENSGSYCECYSRSSLYEYISKVTYGDVANISEKENYGDYTSFSSDFGIGSSFFVSVTIEEFYKDKVNVWVDWNQDFEFTDDEKTSLDIDGNICSGEVVVPVTAKMGKTRMRIVCKYDEDPIPCDSFSYGEVEDYSVNVINGGLTPIFSVSQTSAGVGEELVFSDNSLGDEIISYEWNFGEGATPATVNTKGPHKVTYSTIGEKNISLTISDGTDTKTTTKEGFVNIISGSSTLAQPIYYGAVADHNIIKLSWLAPADEIKMQNPESFESSVFPPAGWEIKFSEDINSPLQDLEDGSTSWELTHGKKSAHSGGFGAYISFFIDKTNWLITPQVEIGENKQLSFYMRYTNDEYSKNKFDVMVKDGESSWTNVKSFDGESPSYTMDDQVVVDLSAYANKSIKIAFVQTYTYGNSIGIDDVAIEDVTGKKTKFIETDKYVSSFSGLKKEKLSDREINQRYKMPYHYPEVNRVGDNSAVPTGFKVFVNGELKETLAADVRSYVMDNVEPGEYNCAIAAVYDDQESFKTTEIKLQTKAPEISFDVDAKQIGQGNELHFTSKLYGSCTSFQWDFGEGASPATSDQLDVTVVYNTLGKKTVKLTINNDITIEKNDLITVFPGTSDVPAIEGLTAVPDYEDITLSWLDLNSEFKMREDFEGEWPPVNWSVKRSETLDGELTDPTEEQRKWFQCDATSFGGNKPEYIHSGLHSAAIGFKATNFNWLITPEIAVADKDELHFWMWYKNGESGGNIYYTNFRVMVKADGKWNQALFYTEGTEPNEFESEVVVDLSAYAGKTTQIAFVYEYSDGFQLMVDDFSILGKGDNVISNDFTQLNIYRDDKKVFETTNAEITKWTDEDLANGEYKYYITYINADGKEASPSNEIYAKAYNTQESPYSDDFESDISEWVFSKEDHSFSVGVTADFNKENFEFPEHEGNYVGVNISDVVGNLFFGYPVAQDFIALTPLNLGGFGGASFELDYFSEVQACGLFGRKGTNSEWTLLKQLGYSKEWKSLKISLPDEVLQDGYQFGLFYSNMAWSSQGIAFDNIKVVTKAGKHITLESGDFELAPGDEYLLGMIKAGTTKDYPISIKNIGNEEVSLGDISLEGDNFEIKTNPANSTLAVGESADIIVTYKPVSVTETPDIATITVNSDAQDSPYITSIKAECGNAEWTYMLYLYEDETGLNGNRDINEWEVLGSIDGKVNYLVLYDADDDTKDGIYYITKDAEGMNSTIVSPLISTEFNTGLDMNNWETLRDFMIWGKEHYPAEHYGCNVWDHGSGIFKKSPIAWKAALGTMKVWELAKALKGFKEVDGQGLDIFGFDVCLLGQVETVYDIKDYTKIVVASEKTEPGNGWDYTTQFAPLNENSKIDIYDLANNFVVEYDASYDNGSQGNQATTQSAIRTDKFNEEFIPALNAFADAILPEMVNLIDVVKNARNTTWFSDGADYDEHRDLGHFLALLKESEGISNEILSTIDDLLDAYYASIIDSKENERPNATGLKIWMPEDIITNSNAVYYTNPDKYLSISETRWDEFLRLYNDPVAEGVPDPKFLYLGDLTMFPGGIVQFLDATTCYPFPTECKWEITPETYEFVNATDESSANIAVKFLEPAEYTIALTVVNSLGKGTTTIENMVVVNAPNFLAPMNLIASMIEETNEVTLVWDEGKEPLAEGVKLYESFEGKWIPEEWEVKYSETIDGEQTEPTGTGGAKWFCGDAASFSAEGEEPNTDYIHSGKHSAAIGFSAPDFNWLISPEFAIETGDQLNFWLWYYNGAVSGTDYYTNFRVMVESEGVWNQEIFYTEGTNSNKYESEVILELAKYVGKSVRIAFVYEYSDGFQMMVDDVQLGLSSKSTKAAPYVSFTELKDDKEVKRFDSPSSTKLADGTHVSYLVYRDGLEIAEVEELTYVDQLSSDVASYEYYVTATYSDPEGESDVSNKVQISIDFSTGINDISQVSYSVYPNPSNGKFFLNVDDINDTNWYLINLSGKMVGKGLIVDNKTEFNIGTKGVYLLKVVSANNNRVFKIVVL